VVAHLLTGRTQHFTRLGVVAVGEVELLIKEPVPTLVKGMAIRADCHLSGIYARLIRIMRVEFSDIASGVNTASV
jgi:hypothetical protein